MTRDEFHAIVMALPGVEEGPSYGQPAYKVNGKFFTRVRKEDASAVVMEVPFDERDLLLEVEPRPSTSPPTTRTTPVCWPGWRRSIPIS